MGQNEIKGRHTPGQVVYAEWAGNDRGKVKMRLVRHYEHPAGNGWEVNIYDHHARRFSKVVQCVSDEAIGNAQTLPPCSCAGLCLSSVTSEDGKPGPVGPGLVACRKS